MALDKCPECKSLISEAAVVCPRCGIGGEALHRMRTEQAEVNQFVGCFFLLVILPATLTISAMILGYIVWPF